MTVSAAYVGKGYDGNIPRISGRRVENWGETTISEKILMENLDYSHHLLICVCENSIKPAKALIHRRDHGDLRW